MALWERVPVADEGLARAVQRPCQAWGPAAVGKSQAVPVPQGLPVVGTSRSVAERWIQAVLEQRARKKQVQPAFLAVAEPWNRELPAQPKGPALLARRSDRFQARRWVEPLAQAPKPARPCCDPADSSRS